MRKVIEFESPGEEIHKLNSTDPLYLSHNSFNPV